MTTTTIARNEIRSAMVAQVEAAESRAIRFMVERSEGRSSAIHDYFAARKEATAIKTRLIFHDRETMRLWRAERALAVAGA